MVSSWRCRLRDIAGQSLSLALEVPARRILSEAAGRAATNSRLRLSALSSSAGGETKQIGWIYSFKCYNCTEQELLYGSEERSGRTQQSITKISKKQQPPSIEYAARWAGHACHSITVLGRRQARSRSRGRREGQSAAFAPLLFPLESVGGVSSNSRDWPGAPSA